MVKSAYITSFQAFIKVNKLTNKQVAIYLGVSTAFTSQIAKGNRRLPSEKLYLIKAKKDWDTTMFDNTNIYLDDKINKRSNVDYQVLLNRLVTEGKFVPISMLEQKDEEIRNLNREIGRIEERLRVAMKIMHGADGSTEK